MLYPSNLEEKIGFDKIREKLKSYCLSSLGEERVDKMRFSNRYDQIKLWLERADEMMRINSEESEELPIQSFPNLRSSLSRVKSLGLYFTENELFELRQSLIGVKNIQVFIAKKEREKYPHIFALSEELPPSDDIIRRIDHILDKFGKIKDNASPELAEIRREILSTQNSISKVLNGILRQAQQAGYVEKDLSPSLRDGRLVIPVLPSYKRKISGIIHDESATGKTVYIEPTQVVEINNRIRELENEEKKEIFKILKVITDELRVHFPHIIRTQKFLAEIDFLRSKYLFSQEIEAVVPDFVNRQTMDWEKAKHPLLYLSLKSQGKEVVPLEIRLNDKERILIISGPNAGGKSVCLQTVVLLQYMIQCGMPIPIHNDSKVGVFQHLFIDIGDNQSIENDLSTYSSHLLNMKYFIKNSNDKTLILIDEFGTGTEPQIGGAIAESCLEQFNENKTFGVITTHYTNLKHFAGQTEGVVNGAMLYDRQNLQPLFLLEIGNPGSSFAIEIARKIGLPNNVIEAVSEKVGSEHLDYDKNLQDVARDKRYWERKRKNIRQKEKELERKLEKYEQELKTTHKKRKEILEKAQLEADLLLKKSNAQIENTIKKIKEAKADKTKTKEVRSQLEEFKGSIKQPVQKKNKVRKNEQNRTKQNEEPLKVGDFVKIDKQNAIGEILEINNQQSIIALGNIKTVVKLKQLTKVKAPKLQSKISNRGLSGNERIHQKKLNFSSEIDVRGMRTDEVLQTIMGYIDDAVMINMEKVKILHGTGTGALRQIIREYLDIAPNVKKYYDEHVQFGGAGITIVELQ